MLSKLFLSSWSESTNQFIQGQKTGLLFEMESLEQLSFSSDSLTADLAFERLSRESLTWLYLLICLNLCSISLLRRKLLGCRSRKELDSIELLELDGIPLQLSDSSDIEQD